MTIYIPDLLEARNYMELDGKTVGELHMPIYGEDENSTYKANMFVGIHKVLEMACLFDRVYLDRIDFQMMMIDMFNNYREEVCMLLQDSKISFINQQSFYMSYQLKSNSKKIIVLASPDISNDELTRNIIEKINEPNQEIIRLIQQAIDNSWNGNELPDIAKIANDCNKGIVDGQYQALGMTENRKMLINDNNVNMYNILLNNFLHNIDTLKPGECTYTASSPGGAYVKLYMSYMIRSDELKGRCVSDMWCNGSDIKADAYNEQGLGRLSGELNINLAHAILGSGDTYSPPDPAFTGNDIVILTEPTNTRVYFSASGTCSPEYIDLKYGESIPDIASRVQVTYPTYSLTYRYTICGEEKVVVEKHPSKYLSRWSQNSIYSRPDSAYESANIKALEGNEYVKIPGMTRQIKYCYDNGFELSRWRMFDGWYLDGAKVTDSVVQVDRNKLFTGKYPDVQIELADSSYAKEKKSTVHFNANTTDPAVSMRGTDVDVNWAFAGWYYKDKYVGTHGDIWTAPDDDNIMLYSKHNPVFINQGYLKSNAPKTVRPNYKLVGWATSPDSTTPVNELVYDGMTLYAIWEPEMVVTPTASPVPTLEPTPTASPVPTLEPTPTASPVPTLEPIPTTSPVPTLEPTPTASPVPTLEPTPTVSPAPTADPTPTVSPSPSVNPSEPEKTSQPVVPSQNTKPGAASENRKQEKVTVKGIQYQITSQTTVECIGAKAGVKRVTIPDTIKIQGKSYQVTSIAKSAFYKQTKLTQLTIGKKVKTIGEKAFYKCSKLKNVKIKSKNVKKVGSKAFYSIKKGAKIQVPRTKLEAYKKLMKKAYATKKTKLI